MDKFIKKRIYYWWIKFIFNFMEKSRYSLSSSTIQKLFDGFKVYKILLWKFDTLKSLVYLLYLSINYLKKNG